MFKFRHEGSGEAPGGPGHKRSYRHSSKDGVGTAVNPADRVWFTLADGVLTEVFHPRIDEEAIHELALAVSAPEGLVPEAESRAQVDQLGPGIPAYRVQRTSDLFRIEKQVLAAPDLEVILQCVRFTPLRHKLSDYRMFVVAAPCLDHHEGDNNAWLDRHRGVEMLFASGPSHALALGCSAPWRARSVGFAQVSDGWQDLQRLGYLEHTYVRAEHGHVVLTGEVDLAACGGVFVLALGLGLRAVEAAHHVRAALLADPGQMVRAYAGAWQRWLDGLLLSQAAPARVSAGVIRVNQDKRTPGSIVASLCVPWGHQNEQGGYHLIWPRDLCHAGGALLAAGAAREAVQVLDYLRAAQEGDGHWVQMTWVSDRAFARGIQLDETALPVLLLDLLRRHGAIGSAAPYADMALRAAEFLLQNGPETEQDRWERDPGISPYTLGAVIAALLVAADLADERGAHGLAARIRGTADEWYGRIDEWLYLRDTAVCAEVGVPGYYIRVTRPKRRSLVAGNHKAESDSIDPRDPEAPVISPDALGLVRFGLRAADDPRVRSSVRVIDALLLVHTPTGPCWHRYNHDHYGEHRDGSPYDGSGVGRAWPLLCGERAHYELLRGRPDEAARLLAAMESFAHRSGMLPEQIWDAADIPERGLYLGRPTGSAAPLVWAHAEHLKLRRSVLEERVFDLPPQTVRRYLGRQPGAIPTEPSLQRAPAPPPQASVVVKWSQTPPGQAG